MHEEKAQFLVFENLFYFSVFSYPTKKSRDY